MIAFLRGLLTAMGDDYVILDVGGVGWQIFTPPVAVSAMPPLGEEVMLHTYMQVREDSCTLFGFPKREQLNMFNLLIAVNGVGARTALLILNVLSPEGVASAVAAEDYRSFTGVSGVGKKTAQRLVLELKDKCASFAGRETRPGLEASGEKESAAGGPTDLAVTALTQLGFTPVEAKKLAARAAGEMRDDASAEELIMVALRLANR